MIFFSFDFPIYGQIHVIFFFSIFFIMAIINHVEGHNYLHQGPTFEFPSLPAQILGMQTNSPNLMIQLNSQGFLFRPIIYLIGVKISQFEEIRFFFLRGNLWHSLPMINIYHQIKTPISFWCKQELNPRSLIQP